jgi:hypothetical protein
MGSFAGCSSSSEDGTAPDVIDPDDQQAGESGANAMAGSGAAASGAAGSSGVGGSSGAGSTNAVNPMSSGPLEAGDGECDADLTYEVEGCPCRAGETAACWTGSAADRNIRECHDGLQVCENNGEFSTWGACVGEELECGEPPLDAGVPPEDPPPTTGCACIPGAVVQCSEDCTALIICSLTATKTCLPDRTWSPCREDLNAVLDLPGFQCRNMFHGCLSAPEDAQGQGEAYVGDCSKQFECGMAPPFL